MSLIYTVLTKHTLDLQYTSVWEYDLTLFTGGENEILI